MNKLKLSELVAIGMTTMLIVVIILTGIYRMIVRASTSPTPGGEIGHAPGYVRACACVREVLSRGGAR